MNDQQQSRADALTEAQRKALETAVNVLNTNWEHETANELREAFTAPILQPALATSANETGAEGANSRPIYVSADNLRLYEAGLYSMFDVGVETPDRTIRLYTAPPAVAAAAPAEEMIRFCPECGRLGDIPAGYEACCPDWSQARIVPKRFAELCAETFRLCVTQPFPQSAASPADGRATCTHQWTWADGKCADCGASTQQPTPTGGMTLGERIAHVGGRVTDGGTVEFGSAMALDALVQHVLRDTRAAASSTDDRAAKISDYLNAPGMWAQVYCGAVFVRGCPSDVARSAADAAVKEFGDAACKTVADLTHTLDEVLRVN
ncbi:hypothetical protein [Burkholderia multivorans]|uniref:hypothetical protein n=1 Tax=Burkholderia multivorans TaxID=87883 RepID=UPI002158D409|nr:hypothetical protein [Burkholderia multivorans]